jgi:GH24 family phage-related lysozyme (muramidase)
MIFKNDVVFDGVVATSDTISGKVGHDFIIKSKQNETKSSGSGFGVNASTSFGGGGISGVGGGINMSKNESGSLKTENQSMLIAKNGGSLEVGNKYSNSGAIVGQAYINEENKVVKSGNSFTIKAKEVENITLQDSSYSKNTSWGIQGSYGINGDTQQAKEGVKPTTKPTAGGNGGGGSGTSGGGSNSGNNSGGQGGISDIIYNTGPMDITMVNKDVSTKQDVYATNLGVKMEAETISGYVNTSADTLRGEEITYINNNLDMNLNIDPKLFTQRGQQEAIDEIQQAIANTKESINFVVDNISNMYTKYINSNNLTPEKKEVVKSNFELVNMEIKKIKEDLDEEIKIINASDDINKETKALMIEIAMSESKLKTLKTSEEFKALLHNIESAKYDNKTGKIRIYDDAQPNVILAFNEKTNKWEGFDQNGNPYLDKNGNPYKQKGTLTTGYGHALTKEELQNPDIIKKYTDGLTEQEANEIFLNDLKAREKSGNNINIDIYKKHNRNLTQNEFDAIMFAIFNVGASGFLNDPTGKAIILDPNNYDIIGKSWLNMKHGGNSGLKIRRKIEFDIYKDAVYKTKEGFEIKVPSLSIKSATQL